MSTPESEDKRRIKAALMCLTRLEVLMKADLMWPDNAQKALNEAQELTHQLSMIGAEKRDS